MGECFTIENSRGNPPEQKVLFRYNGRNVGELEMRNDSPQHYREVRFNINKIPVMELLLDNILERRNYNETILERRNYNETILVYGSAIKTFGNW